MSTGVEPQTPSATPTTASEPNGISPSQAAPGSTSPGSPTPEPFRYGSTAPVWAQGKTAEEVLGVAQQLEGVVRQHISQPSQPAQPYTNQYGSSNQPAPASAPTFDNENWVTGADLNKLAPRMISDAINPQLTGLYESLAQTNMDTVKRGNTAIFDKYGPEVYSLIAKLPVKDRNIDNLTYCVKLVRADHVDELASEIASHRIAGLEPTLRSNGSPSVPVATSEAKYTLQSDAVPQDWKDRAAKAGLTESAVDEFCRANDMSREAFFSQFGTTAITEARR